jgi:hypothetical protein
MNTKPKILFPIVFLAGNERETHIETLSIYEMVAFENRYSTRPVHEMGYGMENRNHGAANT